VTDRQWYLLAGLLFGNAAIVAGVMLIWFPAGLIVLGILLVATAFVLFADLGDV
jgi:membrane protein implicated in regulation of membrane protease activity|tara:strand:+ start:930 stop:1091 length:162 start_codon:yes stop_codon:yes gene_type:complete